MRGNACDPTFMSHRILRKKARTPNVPTRPVTVVTWGKPAKEPYPPDREQYALMAGGNEDGKLLEIKPFPAFSWWRRQTGLKTQKTPKVTRLPEASKTPKSPKTSSSRWWKSKPAAVPSSVYPPATTLTAPRPLPFVTPDANEPVAAEAYDEPWQHHSHYFPEYTPVRPEQSTLTAAYVSKVTPYPVLPDFESFGVTVWQPSMHSTVYAPMATPSSGGQGGVIGRSGK